MRLLEAIMIEENNSDVNSATTIRLNCVVSRDNTAKTIDPRDQALNLFKEL
jgi:hypothetical protein